MDTEDTKLIKEFLHAFEEIFHNDWAYTKDKLNIVEDTSAQQLASKAMGLENMPLIDKGASFLHPGVQNENEDWGNRGKLLELFRQLKTRGY